MAGLPPKTAKQFSLLELLSHIPRISCVIKDTSNNSIDDENLSLTEAAYVLSELAGGWSRDIEGGLKDTKNLLLYLESRQKAKLSEVTETENGKTRKPRTPRWGHPLAHFPDEDLDPENFLRKYTKTADPSAASCLFPTTWKFLPQTSCIPPVDPRTIPILESEKIRSYFDEKGNKGMDWAEFHCNVFPPNLSDTSSRFAVSEPKNEPVEGEIDAGIDMGTVEENGKGNHVEMSIQGNGTNFGVNCDGSLGSIEPNNDASFEFPIPPQNTPTGNEEKKKEPQPFEGFSPFFSITKAMQERDLLVVHQLDELYAEVPFERRAKREIVAVDRKCGPPEVEYYKRFWNFKPSNWIGPKCDLKFVLRRFRTRLRKVEEATKPVKGRGKGKKNDVKKTVKFVSMDVLAENLGKLTVDEEDKENHQDVDGGEAEWVPVSDEDEDDFQKPTKYVEKEGVCGGEQALELDAHNDRLPDIFSAKSDFDGNDHSAVGDLTQNDVTLNLDLNGTIFDLTDTEDLEVWEERLNEFLEAHEVRTRNFDLESYGEHVIADCNRVSGGVVNLRSIANGKKNVGEVCRTFLSLLDLANKNRIEFNSDVINSKANVTFSTVFDDMEATVCMSNGH